ncbi:FtsQ-type POTRA domain-containing protein [Bacillus spongiae]|uniref:Cell division protein DivIB n=1 Tax=Bacillus spongiae TaxID=2683610 RepID=A0ABU8H9T9_9BACI
MEKENENVVSLEDRIPKIKEERKRKTNRRLAFLLCLFFILIASVVYMQSPWSEISHITVQGNNILDDNNIIEHSSLSLGASVWKLNKEAVGEEIESLPEIKSAEIHFIFPNSYIVKVEEYDQIALIFTENLFKPVLESGLVLEGDNLSTQPLPILRDFEDKKMLEEVVQQLKLLPLDVKNRISEIIYTPKQADPYHITLFMNDGYEVSATIRTLAEKLVHYPSIVNQLKEEGKGIIDLEVGSFFRAYEGTKKEEETNNED